MSREEADVVDAIRTHVKTNGWGAYPYTPENLSSTAKAIVSALDALDRSRAAAPEQGDGDPFQARVAPWMQACFGAEISSDVIERNDRFLEESLELVQSLGCTPDDAHRLVDYVFGRPAGEPNQEVGGVMVTLAALCLASGLNMHTAGYKELARVWKCIEEIRAKQAAKLRGSPLPVAAPEPGGEGEAVPFSKLTMACLREIVKEETFGTDDKFDRLFRGEQNIYRSIHELKAKVSSLGSRLDKQHLRLNHVEDQQDAPTCTGCADRIADSDYHSCVPSEPGSKEMVPQKMGRGRTCPYCGAVLGTGAHLCGNQFEASSHGIQVRTGATYDQGPGTLRPSSPAPRAVAEEGETAEQRACRIIGRHNKVKDIVNEIRLAESAAAERGRRELSDQVRAALHSRNFKDLVDVQQTVESLLTPNPTGVPEG